MSELASSALPATVLAWSRGLASLSPGVVPCRGLRPDEWRETHRRCGEFVERWGMQAHAAGWDTLRLFGVGPDTGTLRGDLCGILVPISVDIHEETLEWIKLGRWTAYRHEPVKMPGMVPIWEAKR
ncbi:hypothetical protein NS228_16235 [Methylobacterium indicum]|uniref:hypothetical protein n=1 Tax=Methylobacterium indicum TaxID=1775910 RepID=UPI00079B7944|nr:hypothetical protein [Methylobacterium indicum]KTS37480.1 hypothetical protein NS229_07105 [Methylobacterium indicum]KTS39061.1 hypothetical protein NS228_16235 [Methylobacterium indicum]KTS51408.1 hypothetical protein NS230_13750 [Methylobacterium indicum]